MRKRMYPAQVSSVPLSVLSRLLEVAHVAHRLSCSERHVRRLLRDQKLPAVYLDGMWRVEPDDLQAYIESHRWGNQQATTTQEPDDADDRRTTTTDDDAHTRTRQALPPQVPRKPRTGRLAG